MKKSGTKIVKFNSGGPPMHRSSDTADVQ